ncbi:MAG: hypothetical protein N3A72_09610 [bacterium]|nr:hypothetical protein [bacterium]
MKILLTSVSIGSGHLRAAEAIAVAFRQRYPECCIKHIDTLDYLNPIYRRIYAGGYLMLVKHFPILLGKLYRQTATISFTSLPSSIRITADYLNAGKFIRLLNEYTPDIVVNTHFLAPEIIAMVKKRKRANLLQVTCITDYTAHSFWVNPYIDRLYVGAEVVKQELIQQNIPAEKIMVTGIPIHPQFQQKIEPRTARIHFGLEPNIPSILVLSGGFGIGNVSKLVTRIRATSFPQPIQWVIVAGKNERLRNQLMHGALSGNVPMKIIGYTNEMHMLLDAVDLVVTKAGGLSISEILAKGLPMLIVDPIPGQEEKNTAYIVQHHAGIAVKNISDIPHLLLDLLNNTTRRKELQQNAKLLAKPNAAFDIVNDIAELVASR